MRNNQLRIEQLSLTYTEWTVESIDQSEPGWIYVAEFVDRLYDSLSPFSLYNYRMSKRWYELTEVHHHSTPRLTMNDLMTMLWDGPGYIIKCQRFYISSLLQFYRCEGTGRIHNNSSSEIFPNGVEWPSDLEVQQDEALLFANHDGDPVYAFQHDILPQ